MIAEHLRLSKMLLNIISLNDKSKDINNNFLEFKWNIEKHFFVEEKAIFASYTSRVDAGTKHINLIREHKEMLSMLMEFQKLIEQEKKLDFSKFKKVLFNHQQIEDEYFYTSLENNINEDLKSEIVDKTLEIIKG